MLLHQYGSSYQVTKVKCLRAPYEDAYEPMDFSCITSIILKHTLIHYISNYNEQKCSADVDYFSMCGIYCIFVHPRQSSLICGFFFYLSFFFYLKKFFLVFPEPVKGLRTYVVTTVQIVKPSKTNNVCYFGVLNKCNVSWFDNTNLLIEMCYIFCQYFSWTLQKPLISPWMCRLWIISYSIDLFSASIEFNCENGVTSALLIDA